VILIPEEVKAAPDKYVQISEASSFEIEVTPPVFFKRVTIRKKFKHIENRELPPVIAPASGWQLYLGKFDYLYYYKQVHGSFAFVSAGADLPALRLEVKPQAYE
jgi:hypothetical protein